MLNMVSSIYMVVLLRVSFYLYCSLLKVYWKVPLSNTIICISIMLVCLWLIRGRLPILTPLSGYPNKTNIFTRKTISKLGFGVCCMHLQSRQTRTLCIIYIGEEM